MKKYLIKGLLALFVGSFAASCTEHDVDYVPIAQQKTQAFNAAFREMIGGDVDPNQDWGFTGTPVSALDEDNNIIVHSNSRSNTRLPNSGGWEISGGYSLEFSHSKMDEILRALPEGIPAANKLNDYELVSNGPVEFGIVYSVTSAEDRVGYYYYDPNAGINSRTEELFIKKDGSTIPLQNSNINNDNYYFRYADTNSGLIGTPETNPNNNGWTCPKVWNDFNIDKVYAKKITINIPVGWRMGFFVIDQENLGSHKMYSNKSLTNENNHYYSAIATLTDGTYAVGLEDWWQGDFDCNDIVMAIIPTETKPTIINLDPRVTSESTQHIKQKRLLAQGRVFCEDLGTAGLRDLDFNDIVFDARIWGYREYDAVVKSDGSTEKRNKTNWSYKADLCMLAAGGTIPAKVLGSVFNDYVHTLFNPNIGMTTMVNTVDDHAKITATWDNYFTNPGATTYENLDITDVILALYAADSNHKVKVKDIPISVLWQSSEDASKLGSTMQSVGLLQANLGEVPHKICLPIGTKWPSERINMKGAYPHFDDWAKNKDSYPTFWDTFNEDSLYVGPGSGASLPLTDPYGKPYALNDIDLDKDYFTYGDKVTTTTTTYETVVWEGSEYLGEWAENTHAIDLINGASRFAEMNDNETGYTIRIYGTTTGEPGNGAKDGEWGAKLFDGMWHAFEDYDALSSYDKFQTEGYIEYSPISTTLISHLKNDKDWGNSAILQGRNFTATKISYVKVVVTTTTEHPQ